MVKELMERVEQYEESYSEGGSEGECDIQSQEASRQAQYQSNQPLLSNTAPNLSALNSGKIYQSAQILIPEAICLCKLRALKTCFSLLYKIWSRDSTPGTFKSFTDVGNVVEPHKATDCTLRNVMASTYAYNMM